MVALSWQMLGMGRVEFSQCLSGNGEVAEWLKAPVSKTGMGSWSIEGSNPSLSANFQLRRTYGENQKSRHHRRR
jgi:hypothetical protein